MMRAQEATPIVLPYEDRHRADKLHWYLEASREPREINTQNEAIGHGLFFERHPYDYTDEEFNLPQGHKDRIRTIDPLPVDRARCKEDDDDFILPTDWLECTGKLHRSLDQSFGPETWKSLMMGNFSCQYGNFYSGCTWHFQHVRLQHAEDHKQETKKEIKVLQEMNIRHGLSPSLGVDKLKKERKQALKDHVEDLMTRF
jgi:hypothetical protein